MALSSVELSALISEELMAPARLEWARLRWLQRNIDGGLNKTWMPENADTEYKDLLAKARSPWLAFIQACKAQGLIVDGYSDADVWADAWQRNGMDGRQGALNREAVGLGYSYLMTLPAEGGGVVMRPLSCHQTFSVKGDPWDDNPEYVLHRVNDKRWYFFDAEAHYSITGTPSKIEKLEVVPHGLGSTPVSMVAAQFPLDGFPASPLEPAIPVYKRVVDATFTLQMLQRYGAFPQKYMAGGKIGVDENGNATMRPSVDSMLHSPDYDAKFGSFPSSDISQVANAVDTHIKHLSSVTQVPPHYLLGAIVNMSAEGIAAAESGYFRSIDDYKVVMGEGYELALRSAAAILDYQDAAADTSSQVHWQNTGTRSLAQISDSIVKLQTVGAPLEMLFAMIPGWSKTDALEAARYVKDQGPAKAAPVLQQEVQQALTATGGQVQLPA